MPWNWNRFRLVQVLNLSGELGVLVALLVHLKTMRGLDQMFREGTEALFFIHTQVFSFITPLIRLSRTNYSSPEYSYKPNWKLFLFCSFLHPLIYSVYSLIYNNFLPGPTRFYLENPKHDLTTHLSVTCAESAPFSCPLTLSFSESHRLDISRYMHLFEEQILPYISLWLPAHFN